MSKDKNSKKSGGLFSFLKPSGKSGSEKKKKPYDETAFFNIAAPYIFAFAGVFLIITFIFWEHMSILGMLVHLVTNLFGFASWVLPFALFLIAVRWRTDAPDGLIRFRVICMSVCLVFLSCFLALVLTPETEGNFVEVIEKYRSNGGGYVGGLLCMLFAGICGRIGCGIITGFIAFVFAFLLFGITLGDIFGFLRNKTVSLSKDAYAAHEKRMEEAKLRARATKAERELKNGSKESSVIELEIEDNDEDSDIELNPGEKKRLPCGAKHVEKDMLDDFLDADENINTADINPETGEVCTATEECVFFDDGVDEIFGITGEENADAETNVDDIFCEDAVIAGAGSTFNAKDFVAGNASELTPDGEETENDENGEPSDNPDDVPFDIDAETDIIESDEPDPAELYEFPPTDLLPGNPNPSVFKVTEELTETAKNLVTTLANFNVRTKVMNISCGPTVTRFELKPEVGVKVRSIQNLADDIALHLRASSVRIEAPIPGKDAVGIEIPNKTVHTVYIKELIESDEFKNLQSRLSVALGMDVSGTPVYMDIAKMPHLLIAGATGMGKSVCINSFIVSVLYKARPDEVKLILIDPKKVEFAMYDSIPHLLVPVVTDPKKAAGSLAWAVNEMEHRFNLIEAAKCRDIKSYNAVCEKDPRFKKMCQIVIIIDELADLMMTARDEVETSICRLAQKARAAGMHLIIGTQRPSVDVITGVIKANVPSRIAFTVASQVDSRTILDTVGAENLVGKGDMLYAPVGCMKPTRVQGSFVGPDSVIEEITNFLRGSGIQAYDDEIQNAIELEAMKCAEKKKGKGSSSDGTETYVGSTDGFERDEMMLPALELGVDMGQISTSLVQRKLSLGYARAARIVDMLSEMGFVGPFEGSKPRKVLITREEFLKLKMDQDIDV